MWSGGSAILFLLCYDEMKYMTDLESHFCYILEKILRNLYWDYELDYDTINLLENYVGIASPAKYGIQFFGLLR